MLPEIFKKIKIERDRIFLVQVKFLVFLNFLVNNNYLTIKNFFNWYK